MDIKLPLISMVFLAVLRLATAGADALAADPARNRGTVENATFTSQIADGAPTDFRSEFTSDAAVVYYYGEVLDLAGRTVTHRWKLRGKVMQQVKIPVKGAREPVWSRGTLQPDWTGAWTVEVVNDRGEIIRTDSFSYSPPL